MGRKSVDAAKAMGASRQTSAAHKWLRRFHDEGPDGLGCRLVLGAKALSAPAQFRGGRVHRGRPPRDTSWPSPPGLCAGTTPLDHLWRAATRRGLGPSFIDPPTRTIVRYERERPGELLHVDVKKLGRIRLGGGKRIFGPEFGQPGVTTQKKAGYDYLHVAIDDNSRVAFVQALADEKGPTCAQFLRDATTWFASEDITIERVMTDNARNYRTSKIFQDTLADLGITHKRTRFRRPQTNGKAERFNRTLLEEFAYKTLFTSNEQRLDALDPWLGSYNSDRPHTAIGGLTPLQRLRQQR